jgi:amino acid adenylation domain-containing protein
VAGSVSAHSPLASAATSEDDGSYFPLSAGQEAIWVLYRYAPNDAAYNIANSFLVRGELDLTALEQALQAAVARHEALRTTFEIRQGRPWQRVHPSLPAHFAVERADGWSDASLEAHLAETTRQPFNLERGPLVRMHITMRSAGPPVLQFVVHHIVFDMASLGVILSEMGTLYDAYRTGQDAGLAPVTLQYREYCDRQQATLSGDLGAEHWNYWKETLGGTLPELDLPTDRPRPPIQTYRGGTEQFVLDSDLTEAVTALSRAQGLGRYMTLLAAFGALLYRLTGQNDLLIGFPTAGRSEPELQGIVGYLVNPVLLRLHLHRDLTCTQLLANVRDTAVQAIEHRDYPLPWLAERLQPHRDFSRSPLFQTMFVWQRDVGAAVGLPGATVSLGSLTLEVLPVEQGTAQFDLTLLMGLVENQIAATVKYNADLFDRPTMMRLIEQFQILLRAMAADPEQRIGELALLTPEERHHLLVTWNDTDVSPRPERNLAEAFSAQVERTPDSPAVVLDGKCLTYRELDQRANFLAQQLITVGIGPERIVALHAERSIEIVTAIIAVWKAGGAYLPIDPASPPDRVRFLLEDSQASLLLALREFSDPLMAPDMRTLYLDNLAAPPDAPAVHCGNGAGHDSLAYVLYTSGSTGAPKGVEITQGAVLNLSLALQQSIYEDLGAGPLKVSLNAPLAFDASVKQLIQLLRGHCLYIVPENVRSDPDALLRFLEEKQIDVVDCTPAMVKPLIRAGLFFKTRSGRPVFLVGGEAIDSGLWQTLRQSPGPEFYNVYGPTECTVNTTVCKIRNAGRTPIIGRPLANVRVYVLDQGLQLAPIGVRGELVIGGKGVARGYLNRPDLTAERFIECREISDTKLYRSGDQARLLPDGTIEFLGRLDNQVKVRGYRVELEEVEASLKLHPAVAAAAVTCRTDASGEQSLVATVEPKPGSSVGGEELRTSLRRRLPDYMVPTAFNTVDRIPLTAHGKVDRAALPTLEASLLQMTQGQDAPRTRVEEALKEMWSQLLGIERIGIHDNFFELGGHSLLAIQMIGQLQALFPTDVPLLTLFFAQPTIAGIAEAISQSSAGQEGLDTIVQLLQDLANLSEEEIDRLLYGQAMFDPIDDDPIME